MGLISGSTSSPKRHRPEGSPGHRGCLPAPAACSEGFEEEDAESLLLARQAKDAGSGSESPVSIAMRPRQQHQNPARSADLPQSQETRPGRPRSRRRIQQHQVGMDRRNFTMARLSRRFKMLCVIAATQTAETEHHERLGNRPLAFKQGYRRDAGEESSRRRCSQQGEGRALEHRAVSATSGRDAGSQATAVGTERAKRGAV